jgi:hypothetical protein
VQKPRKAAHHPSPQKPLDKRYTNMITSVMLARQITLPKPPNQANSFAPKLLEPLCSLFAPLSLCFQQLAASFSKTPGWGVPVQLVRRVLTPPLIDFHLPLFSQTYKPLLPQLLCLHIHATPPGGVGVQRDYFQFGKALASMPRTSFSAFL